MRILWLACNKNPARFLEDASFFYRARNPAAALNRAGHTASCIHRKSYDKCTTPDVVVFHRPHDGWGFRCLSRFFRRKNVPILADVDDLIFDPALAHFSPGVVNGLVNLRATRALFSSHNRALTRCDAITTSTEPLAGHLRRCFPGKPVCVVPNCVPLDWELPWSPPVKKEDSRPTLAYFPGTRSHDHDFASITPLLENFFSMHTDWQLLLVGPLDACLQINENRIVRHERVPFHKYPRLLQTATINLAPLTASPFNACKSALKVFEAGHFGIPTLASPLEDAARFSGCGVVIASSPDEWAVGLEQLAEMALRGFFPNRALQERVRKRADIHAAAVKLVEFFASL